MNVPIVELWNSRLSFNSEDGISGLERLVNEDSELATSIE